MKSLHKHFHWFYYKKGKKHLFSLIISIFFWLFLALTQPFGIYGDRFVDLLIGLLPTGAFWFIVIYLVDILLEVLLKGKQKEQIELDLIGWAIKLVIIINAICLFRAYLCGWTCIDLLEYSQLIFACLLMFFLVYLPFAYYATSVYLKSVFSGAELELKTDEVQLGIGKKALIINPPKMIYIQSDDNHLDIYSLNDKQEVKKEIHRSTLISIEQLLSSKYPSFKRVHRSYLVNLNYFKKMETSSGSHTLCLEANGQEFKIPVSRKYKSALQELL